MIGHRRCFEPCRHSNLFCSVSKVTSLSTITNFKSPIQRLLSSAVDEGHHLCHPFLPVPVRHAVLDDAQPPPQSLAKVEAAEQPSAVRLHAVDGGLHVAVVHHGVRWRPSAVKGPPSHQLPDSGQGSRYAAAGLGCTDPCTCNSRRQLAHLYTVRFSVCLHYISA